MTLMRWSRRQVFMRLALITTGSASGALAAPTGLLNDTGQIKCLNVEGNAVEACSEANTGDASARPGQDGRFGRDPASANPAKSGLIKPVGSGGSGGFAFTPLDVNGNVIPLTGTPPVPSTPPRCTWDRVTNLIWEVKTTSGLQDQESTYGWGVNNTGSCVDGSGCSTNAYVYDLHLANVCPVSGAGPWRLPTRRELRSIVDYGRNYPSIDNAYFPNTASRDYWSSDGYGTDDPPTAFWYVRFDNGDSAGGDGPANGNRVRLVRSGP